MELNCVGVAGRALLKLEGCWVGSCGTGKTVFSMGNTLFIGDRGMKQVLAPQLKVAPTL